MSAWIVLAMPLVAWALVIWAPDPPTGVKAVPGDNGIYVEWDLNRRQPVREFRVERQREGDSLSYLMAILPYPVHSFFDSTVVGGVRYAYMVQARDAFGDSSAFSQPAEAVYLDRVPPPAPDSVRVTRSTGGLFVEWAPIRAFDTDRYRVERSTQGAPFETIAVTVQSGFLDRTPLVAVPYDYRVVARDLSGNEGPPSEMVRGIIPDGVPPGLVANLRAEGGVAGIALYWDGPSDSDLAGFRVSRGLTTDEALELSELAPDAASYLDTTALVRKFYIYRVAAFDYSGNEGEPAFAQTLRPDVTAPAAPARFTIRRSATSVSLTWDPSPDPDLEEYRIRITRLRDSTFQSVILPPGSSSLLLNPFSVGIPSQYVVTAVDSSGNASPPSPALETALVPDSLSREGTWSASTFWHLISAPGAGPVIPHFQGTRGLDWDLRAPFSGLEASALEPGRPLWARWTLPWSIPSERVPQVIQSELGFEHTLELRDGWNAIANPFDIPLDWNLVLRWNGTSGTLFGFANGFRPESQMMPYAGYYYFNRDGLDSLTLPFSVERLPGTREPAGRMSLTATFASGDQSRAELVVDPAAAAGLDAWDRLAPPVEFAPNRLVLTGPDGDGFFTMSIPSAQPGTEIPVMVEGPPGRVRFSATGDIGGLRAELIDEGGIGHSLSSGETVVVTRGPSARLLLRVDPDSSLPRDPAPFGIVGAWPNPVEDWLALDFGLPEAARVRLEVRDLTGRLVSFWDLGDQPAGVNQAIWTSPAGLASGSYGLTLLAAGSSGTRRDTRMIQRVR